MPRPLVRWICRTNRTLALVLLCVAAMLALPSLAQADEAAKKSADPTQAAAGDAKGLCRQCARRLTCSYPKPPEGVWQCDELA